MPSHGVPGRLRRQLAGDAGSTEGATEASCVGATVTEDQSVARRKEVQEGSCGLRGATLVRHPSVVLSGLLCNAAGSRCTGEGPS